nr:phospholipid transfer protein isoform X2 [Loxodonta africana]
MPPWGCASGDSCSTGSSMMGATSMPRRRACPSTQLCSSPETLLARSRCPTSPARPLFPEYTQPSGEPSRRYMTSCPHSSPQGCASSSTSSPTSQICPVFHHAGMVLLNSLLRTLPVRSSVDELVGIDYSLLKDPVASVSNLDLEFRGAFFPLAERNWSLPNQAVEPQLQEEERMVYVAFSEFFFDSAMESYFQAGALQLSLVGDKVPHDLDMLLRATYFGSIVLLSPAVIDSPMKLELRVTAPPRCTIKPSGTTISITATVTIALVPPNQPEVQLSSMTMDARLSAKMTLRGKALRTQLDLRKFRIYSNQSALESLALIPLQDPLKAMLQVGVMPIINERTLRGVQIPLPEGINFVREVVTNHASFLTIGADLHFAKGLREVIEKYRPAEARDP